MRPSPLRRVLARDVFARHRIFHIARMTYGKAHARQSLHDHDFSEVFWIERGRGIHLINGQKQPLSRGDVILMRPKDYHSFGVVDLAGLTLVNVAFPTIHLESLRQRHGRHARWPWRGGHLPARFSVHSSLLARLTDWSQTLVMGDQSLVLLEAFLLDLLYRVSACSLDEKQHGYPVWLHQAMEDFGQIEHLKQGTAGFCRLASRCPAHVNRTLRHCMGVTLTQWVNEKRLSFAARELRMTSRSIVQVAEDCGLENLSYFYRLFGQTFGITPRQYRLREQSVMATPSLQ